jgi:hypothetical protein
LSNVLHLPSIDRWGRRPMLVIGTLLMGFWLSLVGGLQGRYGDWGIVDGSRVWVINGHQAATKAIIVCSYLFVSSFAITMGPVSWTVCFLVFESAPIDLCFLVSTRRKSFP